MASQTLRPLLSGLYRKKLVFKFFVQLYDVPLNPGKGLRKASPIELNFLKRHNSVNQLLADPIVTCQGGVRRRRSVHHADPKRGPNPR